MNASLNDIPPINSTLFLIIGTSGIVICVLISLLLFPFFLFVQRQNREEDKKTSVYAIINHFNFIVKFMNLTTSVMIVCWLVNRALWRLGWRVENIQEKLGKDSIVITYVYNYSFIYFPVLLLSLILFSVPLLFRCTIPAVQYVLHFLLGLQRFLIYFFPDTEKYVNLSEKKLKVLLVVLYLIAAINIVIGAKTFGSSLLSLQGLINIYLCLNALQLVSAIFYIPIMFSISKLTNLVSAAVHRPQKYIFYQILTHSLTRLTLVPIFFDDSLTLTHASLFFSCEIFLTPLTIQVAYLLCNRKNVQTLLASPIIELLKSILFPSSRRAQVQPEEVVESTKV